MMLVHGRCQMASRKTNVVKRKGIPLTIVTSSKRLRLQHIKANSRSMEAIDKEYVESINQNERLTDEGLSDMQFEQVDESHSYPTSYTKRKQKAAERWEYIQSIALDVVITSMGEPQVNCAACKSSAGIVICFQCGPISYCEDCAVEIHQNMLFHHYMEIWQVFFCMCNS